jgi:hypothetical protein
MVDTKISQLPAATSANDADELVLNQGGVTKKVAKSVLVSGGGGATFTMPTALADGSGDAGKLLKADSGQAAIADESAATAATDHIWELTVNSVSVAGTPGTQETFTIQLVAEDNAGNYGGAYVVIDAPDGYGDQVLFWFNTDGGDMAPGAYMNEFMVSIMAGDSANQIMQNLRNEIANNLQMDVQTSDDTVDTITCTYHSQGSRNDVTAETSPFPGTLTTTQQGTNGTSGSSITVDDANTIGNIQIQAGNHWTVQGNTTDEAAAITTALQNEVGMADPEMSWSFSSVGNVVTLNRTPRQDETDGGPTGMLDVTASSGNWSGADPSITKTQEGVGGTPQRANGPYIGKLISVSGGVATVDSNRVITLVNEGAVSNGDEVVAASNANAGRIRSAANGNVDQDDIVGIALEGGADGASSTVLLYAERLYLRQL